MTARPLARRAPPPDGPAGGGAVPGGGSAVGPALEWEENPWRESAGGALTAIAVTLAVIALLAGRARPIGSSAGAMGVLLLFVAHALSPSWWPSRYRVDGLGVAARRPFPWRRIPWGEIRRAALIERPVRGLSFGRAARRGRGLFVSTLARPGRLDAFRGLFLPLPGGSDRDRVDSELRLHLARHGF